MSIPKHIEFDVNRLAEDQQTLRAATTKAERVRLASAVVNALREISREVDRHGVEASRRDRTAHRALLDSLDGYIRSYQHYLDNENADSQSSPCHRGIDCSGLRNQLLELWG